MDSTDHPIVTVGIDARAASEVPAGRGRVVRELLRELAARSEDGHRYVLYTRQPWLDEAFDQRFRQRAIDSPDPLWHLRAARAANSECDVFLSSNSYLTTWFLRIPGVPIVYDLVAFDPAMRPNRRSTVIERATLGPAVRRSDSFIAISKATADALAARHPRAATRTTVAPLGVAPLGVPALAVTPLAVAPLAAAPLAVAPVGVTPLGVASADLRPADAAELPSRDFVLAVGTLEPRKNLPRLVEAYSSLPVALKQRHPLVVVGALGWQTGETLHALQSLGEHCKLLGYVTDSTLAELYRRCALFCYPSLGEGFGLPVLEAMAAGAAVLTSNVSSLPEVGGDAVAYADPTRVDLIAAELESLLQDESRRAALADAGRRRAQEFSWARFAEQVLHTLDQAAARG